VIVGAILTQQTSWKNVEKALQNLRLAHVLSPEGIDKCGIDKLEKLITPAGFYRIKAKRLKNFIYFFKERYNLSMNELIKEDKNKLREELLKVSGIGNETADSILLYALDKPTFVVDNYTRRIIYRMGILNNQMKNIEKIKNFFEETLQEEDEQQTIENTKKCMHLLLSLEKIIVKKDLYAVSVLYAKYAKRRSKK